MNNILLLKKESLRAREEADLAYRKYETSLKETFRNLVPKINSHLAGSPYQITGFQIELGEIEVLINCACESLEESEGDRIEKATRRELDVAGLKGIEARLSYDYYGL
jgi:hypothetical protein